MNLDNFEVTGLHTAYETIKEEAATLGVAVAGSEIVGLVPLRALVWHAHPGGRRGGMRTSRVGMWLWDPWTAASYCLSAGAAVAHCCPLPLPARAADGGRVLHR